MKIVFIHGANATQESFNYIREHMEHQEGHLAFSYNSRDGFYFNLQNMIDELEAITEDVFFVCHSLGGIYALHLYNRFPDKIRGVVTLSTPYRGSSQADYAKYFLPFNMLLRDVGSHCAPITETFDIKINIPWTAVVTTKGDSIWMVEPNDGVVSITSMNYRTDVERIEFPLNHYEIVMCPNVVQLINDRINKANDTTNRQRGRKSKKTN
jgi:pimeloyl-ACP methyl ester carboxylesterase